LSDLLFQIMLNCWKMRPDARPNFDTLLMDFRDFESAVENRYYQPVAAVVAGGGYALENNANANTNTNRRKHRPGAERKRAQ
jgi:hypothetical protein